MAEVKWVKLTTDMFDNRKIRYLRTLPEGNSMVLIWVMLITMAGRCNAGGKIFLTENIPYTPKMLADELDFEENTVRLALEALQRLNMIATCPEGFFSIANWEEYQNTDRLAELREYNRLAKQRSREKKKLLQDVNDLSLTGQPGHDTEKEKETETEKENHSFLQAAHTEKIPQKAGESSKRSYLQGSLGKGVVLLSDEQLDDLLEKLSVEEFNRYVEIVADNELCGKHYRRKTHYQAILDMAMQDRRLQ